MSAIVYGIHAVTAALQKKGVAELYLNRGANANRRLDPLADEATRRGVVIRHVASEELDRLADGGRHQGVVARLAAARAAFPADVISYVQSLEHAPLLLVLDGVQDPHNLGACLRSADAAGVDGVIVPRDKAVGLTPAVRKVACGAVDSTPLVQVTNLSRLLDKLREQGFWVVGTSDKASQDLYQTDMKGNLVVVMGAEGKGMRRLTEERCDFLVSLPMAGTVSSLNVSVATGICLFEAVRQRK